MNVFCNLFRKDAGDEVTPSNNKKWHCVYLYTFNDVQQKFIMTTAISAAITSFFKFNGYGVNFWKAIMPTVFTCSLLCSRMNVRKLSFNSLDSEYGLGEYKPVRRVDGTHNTLSQTTIEWPRSTHKAWRRQSSSVKINTARQWVRSHWDAEGWVNEEGRGGTNKQKWACATYCPGWHPFIPVLTSLNWSVLHIFLKKVIAVHVHLGQCSRRTPLDVSLQFRLNLINQSARCDVC